VGEDAISIGTFNLKWAFDNFEAKRTSQAKPHVAPNDEAWQWKRDSIVKILVQEGLDIVALEELGGERELSDIGVKVRDSGGPDYHWAFVPSDDEHTGQHVGILSIYPLDNERRLDANLRKQMAVDIELPGGSKVTVVAVHARHGQYPAHQVDRRKQSRSVKKAITKLNKANPVIVLGTFNSLSLPFHADYPESDVGIIAGKNTSTEADDCMDSAEHGTAQSTSIDESPLDRIFSCGLEMRDATASGQDAIVIKDVDPIDAPWASIPIDAAPFRDVSDHYVVWAEIVLPKAKQPAEGGAADAATSP
jgi:endonuclease/exonuclease/phosphatase family metal-dependent hydrolase